MTIHEKSVATTALFFMAWAAATWFFGPNGFFAPLYIALLVIMLLCLAWVVQGVYEFFREVFFEG